LGECSCSLIGRTPPARLAGEAQAIFSDPQLVALKNLLVKLKACWATPRIFLREQVRAKGNDLVVDLLFYARRFADIFARRFEDIFLSFDSRNGVGEYHRSAAKRRHLEIDMILSSRKTANLFWTDYTVFETHGFL